MNKSIYEEALQALKDLEIILYYDVSKIKQALEQAKEQEKVLELYKQALTGDLGELIINSQKQEKLLELYKEINNKRKELITLTRFNTWYWNLDVEIREIEKRIRELEK